MIITAMDEDKFKVGDKVYICGDNYAPEEAELCDVNRDPMSPVYTVKSTGNGWYKGTNHVFADRRDCEVECMLRRLSALETRLSLDVRQAKDMVRTLEDCRLNIDGMCWCIENLLRKKEEK